jgi:hypothetical protein
MTHIILVDPATELVLHNIEIGTKKDAARCEEYRKQEETARGHAVDRIIASMGTVRIMEPGDPIPIPIERPIRSMVMS